MAIDTGKLEDFLGRFTADLGATVAAGNVVIGHRLGLYQALAAGPADAGELAARTGTSRGNSSGGEPHPGTARAGGGFSMKRQNPIPLAAAALAAAVALPACSGNGTPIPQQTSAGYDAALNAVVNPSAHRGGTIIFDNSTSPDSTDPGNTYYAYTWNTARLYARTLVTYKSAPGAAGLQLVPDLATSLGTVSDHGLTWTYHLRPGIKFEDGTLVTSQDVKYAVERSYAKDVLPGGPSYFQLLLNDPAYPGPYKDKTPGKMGLTSITTPDAATIVFHLQKPFADFDYVAALPQTAPVPPGKDTGVNYQRHPVSTGPYMFASYQLKKQFTLVKNRHWDPATDPNRKQLAGTLVFNLNVHPDMVDANLLHNYAQVDQGGFGVQGAARAQILASPRLKNHADDPLPGSCGSPPSTSRSSR